MKRLFLFLALFAIATMACNLLTPQPIPSEPVTEPIPPQDVPVQPDPLPTATTPPEPTAPQPGFRFEQVSLTLPPGLAAGASGLSIAPAQGEEVAPWEVTPGHIEINLDGYIHADKFHRARLLVFPVVGLAAAQPSAAENITRLQTLLANPSAPLSIYDLPGIHFFNAGAVLAANTRVIGFQNGSGVRSLAIYGQYFAPANNDELFYHFQGLTENGQYYIIAILPLTHPGLQADSQEGSLPPSGEFPVYPGFSATDVDLQNYYSTVTSLLTSASPDSFSPSLNDLDALIESILIAP